MRYKNITTFSYLRYISLRQKDYSGMRSGRGIIVAIMNVNRVAQFFSSLVVIYRDEEGGREEREGEILNQLHCR